MKILLIAMLMLICCVISTADGKMPLDSMLVNDKILQLVDSRQLTFAEDGEISQIAVSPDGKQVAFISEDEQNRRLCLVNSAGGKVTAVMSSPPQDKVYTIESPPKELWYVNYPQWSPSGDSLFVEAARSTATRDEEGNLGVVEDEFHYLLVLARNGKMKSSIPYPHVYLSGDLKVSPDGQSAASAYSLIDEDQPGAMHQEGIVLFDLIRGSSRILFTDKTSLCGSILEWSSDSKSLVWMSDTRGDKLKNVWLDDKPVQDMRGVSVSSLDSPDRQLRMLIDESGLSVKNLQTDAEAPVISDGDVEFLGWAPNSRMFLYSRAQTITDKANGRKGEVNSLWIAHVGSTKPNSMLVAMNCVEYACVSSDGTGVFYVSDKERLCVSELEWHTPTAEERMAAGLPLTENDEKSIITQNAKKMGVAIVMYSADWDDAFPNAESIEDDLTPYIEAASLSDEGNVFARPGTDQRIFKYLIEPGIKASDIADPSTTPIGEFDSDFGWKIVLYADGHVQREAK